MSCVCCCDTCERVGVRSRQCRFHQSACCQKGSGTVSSLQATGASVYTSRELRALNIHGYAGRHIAALCQKLYTNILANPTAKRTEAVACCVNSVIQPTILLVPLKRNRSHTSKLTTEFKSTIHHLFHIPGSVDN